MSLVSRAMTFALACAGSGTDAHVEIRVRRAVFSMTGRNGSKAGEGFRRVQFFAGAWVNERELLAKEGKDQTEALEQLIAALKQRATDQVLELQHVLGQREDAP